MTAVKIIPSMPTLHHIDDIIQLFDAEFAGQENTRLIRGADEPWYLPADSNCRYHQVVFAHGFYASALHEIAHWCIAGKERRQQVDYGYWYEPDGRNVAQQLAFAAVEAKPQALEWILAKACGFRFVVSLDNLSGEAGDWQPFKQAVVDAVAGYRQHGLPPRALQLQQVLARFYRQDANWHNYTFGLAEL